MNLFDALKQYIRDAAPGGLLNPEGEPVVQYGRKVKGNVRGLLDDPAAFTQSALLDVLPSGAELDSVRARAEGRDYDKFSYQKAIDKAIDLGSLVGSIRVYHGSPHKFDKFDLSKIGTGEGAQAYGHGLYTAESRGVAEQYKNALSDTLDAPMNTPALEKRAGQMALTFGDNTSDGAVKWLQKHRNGAKHTSPALTPELVDDVIRRFQSGEFHPGGNLYEANLRWPDAAREAADPMGPQHFLDWDKPLSEQSEAVKKAFAKADARYGPLRNRAPILDAKSPMHGQDAYRDLTNALVDSHVMRGSTGSKDHVTSAYLRDLGIPGIRYLDAGSRGAGQGTANYVVFDDALIEILKRNGVPVK